MASWVQASTPRPPMAGAFPRGVAVDGDGTIRVADPDAGTNGAGALFRVDPATGGRTLLSDFGDAAQGPIGVRPFWVRVVD